MNQQARPTKYQSKRDYVAANFASARCAGPASSSLLFLDLPPRRPHVGHRRTPTSCAATRTTTWSHSFAARAGRDRLHRRQHRARRSTCSTAPGACSRASGSTTRASTSCAARLRRSAFAALIIVGNAQLPDRGPRRRRRAERLSRHRTVTPTIDARLQDPRRARSSEKWDNHKFDMKLVNPANKRKFEIIVVGTGLAGASAAATLGRARLQGEGRSRSTTRPAGRTRSPRRAASTRRRTTRTTATASTASSTTR